MKWHSTQEKGVLNNVLGLFQGSDPSLAQETVIIGAHRDHFGRQAGLVFPGADDNASGTAVMLEVARLFAKSGLTPKRSLLFISFSGEEQGLLGSRLYVDQPTRPLANTVAMINIDHAGVGNGRLTVGITELDTSQAAQAGEHAGVGDKVDLFGFFPGGDHVPFKEAGVPTITIVSGGPHPHFHQPSDSSDTVRPEILELTVRYVVALAWQLAN
jgi:Zn-dependent M28 family amino/carboxypeptidase